jgi:hypothetical protein
VTDEERIEQFLLNSGLVAQSVEALRPKFARWARYLHEQGVEEIPTSPWAAYADPHGVNLLCKAVKEVALVKDSSGAHELRNLTRVRPCKL